MPLAAEEKNKMRREKGTNTKDRGAKQKPELFSG